MKRSLALVLLLSLGLHGVGFGVFNTSEDIVVQGGAPATAARLGNSFADMVSGVTTPVTPEDADTLHPEETRASAPVDAERPTDRATPSPLSETTSPISSAPTPVPRVKTGVVVAPSFAPAAQSSMLAARLPEESDATSRTAPQSVRPSRPIEAAPTQAEDRTTGRTPIAVQQADANTERPRARPDPNRRAETPTRPATQGTAAQDAARGSNDGTREATSNTASSNDRSVSQQGNSAAATNYPGQIWSKLQRGRLSGSAGRGSAVVSFRIAPNGRLAALAIARSSGVAQLDRAALSHVRRAAPFPAPPPGAKTRFNFTYEVR
ncbi:MAG: TonB family protein [Pseudomonadota bacterium]